MKEQIIVAPVAAALVAAGCLMLVQPACASPGDLPNPTLTPGEINPDVTQGNISSTVCVRGWTKTVRPPAFYTNRLKRIQLRQYGYHL